MGYFKPLRRKIGVVTLVLACVFMVAWVRSQVVVDAMSITCSRWQHFLFSDNFGIWWETDLISQKGRQVPFFGDFSKWYLQSNKRATPPPEAPDFEFAANPDIVLTSYGFYYAVLFSKNQNPPLVKSTWIIPYWSIILPLTLLSAWLLLSKPRVKKPA